MADDVESLRRQLSEAQDNLRLIEERMAQYVLAVDVPLQLVKGKERLEARMADLQERIARLEGEESPRRLIAGAKGEAPPPKPKRTAPWRWVLRFLAILAVVASIV